MTMHSATGLLAVVSSDPEAVPAEPAPPAGWRAVVRPGDLVTALTGVTLCFFSIFVFAIVEWQYVGPDVERAGVLGWLAPLLAGAACIIVAGVSVGVRLALRPSADSTRADA